MARARRFTDTPRETREIHALALEPSNSSESPSAVGRRGYGFSFNELRMVHIKGMNRSRVEDHESEDEKWVQDGFERGGARDANGTNPRRGVQSLLRSRHGGVTSLARSSVRGVARVGRRRRRHRLLPRRHGSLRPHAVVTSRHAHLGLAHARRCVPVVLRRLGTHAALDADKDQEEGEGDPRDPGPGFDAACEVARRTEAPDPAVVAVRERCRAACVRGRAVSA